MGYHIPADHHGPTPADVRKAKRYYCSTCRSEVDGACREGAGFVCALREKKAEASRKRCKPDEHDWQPTDHWLIDRCAKCGDERA